MRASASSISTTDSRACASAQDHAHVRRPSCRPLLLIIKLHIAHLGFFDEACRLCIKLIGLADEARSLCDEELSLRFQEFDIKVLRVGNSIFGPTTNLR